MAAFVLWLLLLVVCWPLALLALVLYPLVWLLLLPFRILGVAVDGVLGLFKAVLSSRRGCWAGRGRCGAEGGGRRRQRRDRPRDESTTSSPTRKGVQPS